MTLATPAPAFAPPVLDGFHFYSACGQSVPWNSVWYTAPFFTASSAAYDSIASTGQVEPPPSIFLTESACQALQSSLSVQSISSRASISSLATLSSLSVASEASATSLASARSRSDLSTLSPTATPSSAKPSSPLVPTATPSSGISSSQVSSTCAGEWDPQAKSVTAAAVWTVLAGALVWLAFALVRGRMAIIYEARRWFIPIENRPFPVHASLLSFLFPPIPLLPPIQSPLTTDVHMHIHTLFTSLRIVGIWTVASLVAVLPLYTVNMPCLAVVRGRSPLGGSTGSLTDLSLLRLLDALDSASLNPTNSLAKRDASTPPSDAHTRLLVLTILLPLLTVLPAFFLVLRAYRQAVRFRTRYLEETCGGLEMVWLSFAPEGLGEEAMRSILREKGLLKEGPILEEERRERESDDVGETMRELEVSVMRVFAVPDTRKLDELVEARFEALNRLEASENVYINSFEIKPEDASPNASHSDIASGSSRGCRTSLTSSLRGPKRVPTSYLAPAQYYRVDGTTPTTTPLPSPVLPKFVRPILGERGASSTSRFREVERDSGFFGGRTGKLEPGTRLKEDLVRGLVIAPGSSEGESEFGGDGRPGGDRRETDDMLRPDASSRTDNSRHLSPSPSRYRQGSVNFPSCRGSGRRPSLINDPNLRLRPGRDEDQLAQAYHTIVESRGTLKRLNDEVATAQSQALKDVTTGRNLHGFILTGSNVRFLDQAVPIDGAAQGDIVWLELQKSKGTHSRWGVVRFWLGTALVGVVLAGACLPFLALTVASAPGVSRYIGVFHGLSTSTDLGAALVFGLVPALVISLFVALAVCFIEFLARHSGVISYSRRRQLVFQAVWVVVLVVCGGWLIVCSSILFASSALNANNAESSGVADGSIYSSGFFLIFLVNLALVAPGLQLLQPSRLWRTVRSLRNSSTPRQRFRASIPSPFHATFLQVITLVAVFYSAAFSLIFPLIGIPAFIVLLLALVALRYRVYYVHSHVGQDGGKNTMWLISRFGFLICLTPLLYGLVLLSRRIWSYAAGMLAVALFSLVVVEICTYLMGRRPTRRHLPSPALTSLAALEDRFRSITLGRKPVVRNIDLPSQTQSAVDQPMTGSSRERRSSLASILNLLDRFLASSRAVRERPLSIPLRATECIDDMVSTELAAATHPSAPPHLILDPADALRPLCYPPSVLQPPVTVWLRDGDSRVGRREAEDLDHFHSLPSIVSNH